MGRTASDRRLGSAGCTDCAGGADSARGNEGRRLTWHYKLYESDICTSSDIGIDILREQRGTGGAKRSPCAANTHDGTVVTGMSGSSIGSIENSNLRTDSSVGTEGSIRSKGNAAVDSASVEQVDAGDTALDEAHGDSGGAPVGEEYAADVNSGGLGGGIYDSTNVDVNSSAPGAAGVDAAAVRSIVYDVAASMETDVTNSLLTQSTDVHTVKLAAWDGEGAAANGDKMGTADVNNAHVGGLEVQTTEAVPADVDRVVPGTAEVEHSRGCSVKADTA